MNIQYTLFAIISGLALSEGLRCWTCDNQPSNDACTRRGKLRTCQFNQKACQNEVRVVDRGILITKRCKQAHACDNNFIQNERPAWSPTQCNIKTKSSTCRCCCFSNKCNEGLECNGPTPSPPQRRIRPFPTCQALQAPVHGRMTCSAGERSARRGDTCSFSCDTGYKLQGFQVRKCMIFRKGPMRFNGRNPACLPEPKCETKPTPENGEMSCTDLNSVGSSCTFTCNEGYALLGNNSSTCGSDGTWSFVFPACVRITCSPEQISPQNGVVTCRDSDNVGSECQYSCHDGYDLIGATNSRICLSNEDGTSRGFWSNSVPFCQPKTCDPAYAAPSNGDVSCTNGNFFGSNCTFECNSDYALIGATSSVCVLVADESVSWSSEGPVCEFIERAPERLRSTTERCSVELDAPTNGQISCSDGNEYKSECVFSCNDGFSLGGEGIRVCDDGLNSLEWTAETPTCEEIVCPSQTISQNGNIECTLDMNYNSVCSFHCNKGYSLYPPNITENTCQGDSKWNYQAPCCARMCPPYSFMDAVIILDSSSSIGRRNWNSMKLFIRGIIDLFEILPDSSRIAVFRYNAKIDKKTQIFLDSFPDNKTALLNKYDEIPYNGEGTNTGNALEHARNVSLAQGNRPEAKDVVIVVTDGRSQDDVHIISEKLRDDGVLTYAIGIVPPTNSSRGPDEDQLLSIAGETDHYFLVEDGFKGLNEKFSAQLEKEICSVDPCSS